MMTKIFKKILRFAGPFDGFVPLLVVALIFTPIFIYIKHPFILVLAGYGLYPFDTWMRNIVDERLGE